MEPLGTNGIAQLGDNTPPVYQGRDDNYPVTRLVNLLHSSGAYFICKTASVPSVSGAMVSLSSNIVSNHDRQIHQAVGNVKVIVHKKW